MGHPPIFNEKLINRVALFTGALQPHALCKQKQMLLVANKNDIKPKRHKSVGSADRSLTTTCSYYNNMFKTNDMEKWTGADPVDCF